MKSKVKEEKEGDPSLSLFSCLPHISLSHLLPDVQLEQEGNKYRERKGKVNDSDYYFIPLQMLTSFRSEMCPRD